MVSRASHSSVDRSASLSSHVNYRYMTTPEKHKRMTLLHKENRSIQLKAIKLKAKLSKVMNKVGVSLNSDLTNDLHEVMEITEHQALKEFQPGTFQHIFWHQQKEAAEKDRRGIQWHPAMIKWCLFLRHQSSRAYETLQQSGVIHLPSQRTLRDYSQSIKTGAGFSEEVDLQLLQANNQATCNEWEKFVILLLDEMYIGSDLVYDKHTKNLIGFTTLGNVNDHLLRFEKSLSGVDSEVNDVDLDVDVEDDQEELAKTMMVFMVRGIFTRLRFPYAQFPCASVTGDLLYQPFWEAIGRLERMEFKVCKIIMT